MRIGIIGLGNAGLLHLRAVRGGLVDGAALTAVVCKRARAEAIGAELGTAAVFDDDAALRASGLCDAVIVATPHPAHPRQTIDALAVGLHVLCEKPAGVSAAEARAMAGAAERAGRCYAMNFSRRVAPAYRRLRALVADGTLGVVQRASWTSTAWLRSQAYFDSSPWRGTWAGEGGGLLVNQLPHVLDLWQWILGSPRRLLARCGMGRYHDLDVEDEVHVLAEYDNGASFVLIGSTGEAPGVERVEIVGTHGTAVLEHRRLTVVRPDASTPAFIRTAPEGFDRPRTTTQIETFDDEGDLVAGVTRNFIAAVRDGVPLIAPGRDGVASLELANAILLSHWDERWVELPFEQIRFERKLRELQKRTNAARPQAARVVDLKTSFGHP